MVLVSMLASQSGFSQFNGFFQEDEADLNKFEDGVIFGVIGGDGFVLDASSPADEGNVITYEIPSLVRFNDSGTQLWSAYLDAGDGSSGAQILANPVDTSRG